MAELHGEALDRAVAGVLGWTHMVPGPGWQMPEVLHWYDPSGKFVGRLPKFSSDWSRLPEMLAWLQANAVRAEVVTRNADGWDYVVTVWLPSGFGRTHRRMTAEGETLPIAVARLVVAVAEAKDA